MHLPIGWIDSNARLEINEMKLARGGVLQSSDARLEINGMQLVRGGVPNEEHPWWRG